uniref:Vacuolar iron transporter n=1 Tax=Oryza brachyantha TaxID=4533 RepID=J3LYM2_ORYBR
MDGEGRPLLADKVPDHPEQHFTSGEVVRDVIMGVSDGLTVPFALAAGLSGASAPSSLVLTAGLAEVAAGAISMGLGGFAFSLCYKNKGQTLGFHHQNRKPMHLLLAADIFHVPVEQEMCARHKQFRALGWRTGRKSYWALVLTRYLAAKSEADHYQREMKREQEEIIAVPDTGKLISRYNKDTIH